MCLTIAEGRAMVNAARKYHRVTQVGTQQRSMPINNWASDLVRNGALGKVPRCWPPTSSVLFAGRKLVAERQGPVDRWWDVWTNQAELRPYDPDIHYGWASWWDYDGGGLCFGVTGWGTHSYDQINRALGTDETGPVEVLLEEPSASRDYGQVRRGRTVGGLSFVIGEDTGRVVAGYRRRLLRHGQVTGPRAKVAMKFASGTELKLHLDGDRGPGSGRSSSAKKARSKSTGTSWPATPKRSSAAGQPRSQQAARNLLSHRELGPCIKTRKRCNADIEYGQRSSTLCYLVNIVREVGRVGQTLKWDPAAKRFTNCDEANRCYRDRDARATNCRKSTSRLLRNGVLQRRRSRSVPLVRGRPHSDCCISANAGL